MMTDSSLDPHSTTALLAADQQDALGIVTCPMCHTPSSLTQSALAAGGDWRCVTCKQHWDAARLAAVAAYAEWVVDHDTRGLQRGTEGSEGEAHS